MKTKMKPNLNSESGMATLEALPLVIIFMVMIAYMLGMYGVTHTAILNSIGARNYAFETFRHRADLTYFRSNTTANVMSFEAIGARVHAVTNESSETSDGGQFAATIRKIAMGLDSSREDFARPPATIHNQEGSNNVYAIQDKARNTAIGARDVWIMTQYGICLDAKCGAR